MSALAKKLNNKRLYSSLKVRLPFFISMIPSYKDLAVTFDNKLSIIFHYVDVLSRASRM